MNVIKRMYFYFLTLAHFASERDRVEGGTKKMQEKTTSVVREGQHH